MVKMIEWIHTFVYFCMEEIWERVPVQWRQHKFLLLTNCFIKFIPVSNRGPRISVKHFATAVASMLTIRPWPKVLALAKWHRTPVTAACRSWVWIILHRAANSWYLREDAILYGANTYENISPCTASRLNTNYERIASWGRCQFRTGVYIYIYIYIYIFVHYIAISQSQGRNGTTWSVIGQYNLYFLHEKPYWAVLRKPSNIGAILDSF